MIFSFSVLGFVCFADFEVDGRPKSWLTSVPERVTVEPWTAVTLPEARAKFAAPGNRLVRLLRFGSENCRSAGSTRTQASGTRSGTEPAARAGSPNPAPPPNPGLVHVPALDTLLIVMDRAAIVVFDFFDGVPVTVRQSPTAIALRFGGGLGERRCRGPGDRGLRGGTLHLHRRARNGRHAPTGGHCPPVVAESGTGGRARPEDEAQASHTPATSPSLPKVRLLRVLGHSS